MTTTTTTAAAAEKIERCSAQMLLKYPWWASLYLNLIRVETEAGGIDTMAVDGTHLFFNPKFTESLTDKECVGVLLHETAHIAFLHCYRRKYREPRRWNVACDKAINAVLLAANIELPKGGVPPGPLGMLAEELYEQISDAEMALYNRDVIEAGTMQGVEGAGTKEMSEKDWRTAIAASHGLMPDSVARIVEEATAARKDWKEELARFIHSTCKSDTRTWARQSRRIKGLPGWSRELESNIVIVLDTSGSVTGPILSAFAAECRAITALNGITAVIMSADARVHQVIQPGEPFPTEWKGGGGTNFIPALKAAEDYEPNCVIYLTDGCGTYPKSSLYPVLWALTAPRTVPFGKKSYWRVSMAPKIKHRVRVILKNQNGNVVQDNVDASTYVHTYGAYLRVPVVQKVGVPITYTVTVEYLGEHQYKQTLAQRTKTHERNQERTKKWKEEQARLEVERQEKQLIQRRERIMNQIELAFVKKGKDAVNFVTCDKCDAMAKFLGLAFENPGSTVIDPDQITGAWCQDHNSQHQRPFKTKAAIPCERLEFFYDGLRQIYVNKEVAQTEYSMIT